MKLKTMNGTVNMLKVPVRNLLSKNGQINKQCFNI